MRRALGVFAAALTWGAVGAAGAQQMPTWIFGSGGGVSEAGEVRHFSATGLGLPAGKSEGGGITAYHGYLPRTARVRDVTPPEIVVPRDVRVSTLRDACAALVNLPAVQVTDDHDPRPRVTVTLETEPPQDIDPAGGEVRLEVGTYDVLIVARDRYGNESQASYRVDVVDGAPPRIEPVPDPTPIGGEAEAASPAGTAVELRYDCVDACDPEPAVTQEPRLVRYPLGDTGVVLRCRDSSGNEAREGVLVRVRDRTPPALAAALPDGAGAECDSPAGARYRVPRPVWADNATSAPALQLSLIVDPDGANRAFDGLPEHVDLTLGRHVLRYVAVDAAGNRGTADLTVEITDSGEPTIEVLEVPENGWHGGPGDVRVVIAIASGCSGRADGLQVNVVPPPVAMAMDGNRVTLTYREEGRYRLNITVRDAEGNEARDSSVGFGIDRNPPQAVMRVPGPIGAGDGPRTWPIFARDQRLAIDVGGEEEADGTPSGIANVTVILDPDDPARMRVLADRDFGGVGNPPLGQRVAVGVGCELTQRAGPGGVVIRDGYCGADLALDLRQVRRGAHVLEVTVTDFAGNSSTGSTRFLNLDLNTGAVELLARVTEMIQGDPGAARGALVAAARELAAVRDLSALPIEDAPHDTPLFLNAALGAAQRATIGLMQAIDAAEAPLAQRITGLVDALQRVARADVVLMHAYSASLDRQQLPRFLRDAYAVDAELLDRTLASVAQALGARAWAQAATDLSNAGFYAKSAYSAWMMDYHSVPAPIDRAAVLAEYARGRDILADIRDELSVYLTLDEPPAAVQVQRIRDRLNTVIQRLDTLARDGFRTANGQVGLTDEAYVDALIELREVANVSTEAGNRGAAVRNYQWSMMQVIRYMTQASVEDAIVSFGGGRRNWPIYRHSAELIELGVDLLDDRRVQEVINLYGLDEDAICLVTAVYHCDFRHDEGAADVDQPIPEAETADFCWARMWRPREWPGLAPAGGIPPECQYSPEGDLR